MWCWRLDLPLSSSNGAQSGESCNLFAADLSEFGHPDDDGKHGSHGEAGNAEHEIEAPGEIVVSAKLSFDEKHLGSPPCLEPHNVIGDEPSQSRFIDMLEPDLE